MRALFLLLALAGCSAAKPKPQFSAIHILDIKRADDPALEDCIHRCDPDDAALASALKESIQVQEAYLHRQPVSEASLKSASRKLTQTALAWYRKKKDSKDPSEALAAYQLAVIAEGMGFQDLTSPSFGDELNTGLAGLPGRFPNDARAYVLYGHYLSHSTPPLEDVIRAYRRCVELDPSIKECRRRYDDAVSDYEEKFCAGDGLDESFGFYLSSRKKDASHPVRLRSPDGSVFVGKKPELAREDIARLMVASAPSDQDVPPDELRIEMTPEGARRLSDLTRDHLREFMAVGLKGKALLNAAILSPVTEGKISVTMGPQPSPETRARSLFDTACPKPSSRKLPENLKLPPPASKGA